MSNNLPPNHRQASITLSEVAESIDRSRLSFRRRFTINGQIQRGEAYMDGSRILIHECRPLMNKRDEVVVLTQFER
jgi:hypothetical protein